jgi:hypothetical protein
LRRAGGGLGGVASLLARPLVRPGRCVRLLVVGVAYLFYDYYRDEAEAFAAPVQQFKYGSTGGDRLAGIPVGIFNALPKLCHDYLPGEGWKSLGFMFEPGMDRPVGTSKRRSLGFDRIGLNCATCHVGTYRDAPQSRFSAVRRRRGRSQRARSRASGCRRIGVLMNIPGHPSVMQKWDGERKSRTSAPLKRVKTPTRQTGGQAG